MWMFILCLCIMWLLKSQSVVNRSCRRGAQIIDYYYQLFNSGHIFPTFSLLLSSVMIDWKCPSGLEAWVSVKIMLYLATLVQTFWTYGHTVTSSVQTKATNKNNPIMIIYNYPSGYTTQKLRHYDVKTTWWRRFNVTMTLSLRHVLVGMHHLQLAAISQTAVSNAFSWMKMLYFDSNSTEVCSQGSN